MSERPSVPDRIKNIADPEKRQRALSKWAHGMTSSGAEVRRLPRRFRNMTEEQRKDAITRDAGKGADRHWASGEATDKAQHSERPPSTRG
ncbi:hypothetical protein [Streptomyces albofaciens]|uniref:hypothetical protein n=1 Tax=Streptomyces albofaciens TaxID=66866 RepID=UPI001239DE81|nr:hypothetical protein [Streptomyces albofaciens]